MCKYVPEDTHGQFIKKIVKNEKNEYVGVIVSMGFFEKNEFNIAFSAIKPDSDDLFDKDFGTAIAINKALKNANRTKKIFVPKQMQDAFLEMAIRSVRYFKNMAPSIRVLKSIEYINKLRFHGNPHSWQKRPIVKEAVNVNIDNEWLSNL